MSVFPMPIVLLPLACGEALGGPFEAPAEAARLASEGWRGDYLDGPTGRGVWGAHTRAALALAEVLAARGAYDPPSVVAAYDALRGGPPPPAALDVDAAVPCDAAVRAVALGLFAASRASFTDAELGATAAEDARITHAHRDAEAGALAVALAVRALATGAERAELPRLLLGALDVAGYCRTRVRGLLATVGMMFPHTLPPAAFAGMVGRSEDVAELLTTALHCVIAPRYGFPTSSPHGRRPVLNAVAMGGATGARAALVAALVGAEEGLLAFPVVWLTGCAEAARPLTLDARLQRLGSPQDVWHPVVSGDVVLGALPVSRDASDETVKERLPTQLLGLRAAFDDRTVANVSYHPGRYVAATLVSR